MSGTDEFALPAILQNTVKKLSAREGVIGILICDIDGLTLTTNLSGTQSELISAQVSSLVSKTIRVMDSVKTAGELSSIFIEMNTKELIITPDQEAGFIIVVLKKRVKK